MPGFSKFESNAAASLDLENLFKNAVKNWHGSIETVPFNSDSAEVTGRLFCGNLAVLTSLIGTPYFEPFKEPTILVIEDIGENPGRVIRAWTQWQQSGMLSNVSAVVLGRFTNMPGDNEKQEILIQGELRKRSPKLPFFVTGQVGHIAENYPLLVGSLATLRDNRLSWKA
jgi:muramoyltetrapeptide carboxypeptidase